jgi:uncharacterized DUF497 family protein
MDLVLDWDSEKNKLLISSRGVSFEAVVAILENDDMLDMLEHPNKKKYAHQKMYVVEISGYAYLVPFVQQNNKIFLKTIIPSRKAQKKYLSE